MAFPTLKIIIVAIFLALLTGGYFYVTGLQDKVQSQRIALEVAEGQRKELVQQVKDLSIAEQAFKDKLVLAEGERSAIRQQLSTSLAKLRNQKPPVECKTAIDWAITNRSDLSWEK